MPALALFILMMVADPPAAPAPPAAPVPPAAPAPPAGDLTFEKAAALASRDSRALSANQMTAMVGALSRASTEAMAHCPEPVKAPDFASFTLIMELDASGHVTRTWLDGTTAVAICFDKAMRQQAIFKPPQAPFYAAYDMNWQQ